MLSKIEIVAIVGFIILIILTAIAMYFTIPKMIAQSEACIEKGGTYYISPPICEITKEQQQIDELRERIEELEEQLD